MRNRSRQRTHHVSSGAVEAFDPADLVLSGWWRASYGGSPWVGVASAGASGTRNLTEATNPPGVGAAVNELTPADFDGANDKLGSAVLINTYVSNAAGSIACLFNADVAAADAGAQFPYENPPLFADEAGLLALEFSDSGVSFGAFNGTDYDRVTVACPTGAWHVVQARWNTTTFEIRLDGGAWVTAAGVVDLDSDPRSIRVGANWELAKFFNGKTLELMTAQTRWSNDEADGILAYLIARYGVPT